MRLGRLFATAGSAAALTVGSVFLVAPAPAVAATCSDGGGVSVVVDYRELGGSMVTACVPDGAGKSATAISTAAGVTITYAQRQPGFVCRVNDVPTSDPCVNTSPMDAYWGLWWSDGTRTWAYSSSGSGSLEVPAGGSVGWSWQQDRAGQAVPPGLAAPTAPPPVSPTATPSPTASATPSPTRPAKPTKARDRGTGPKQTGRSGSASPSPAPSSSPASPSASALPSTAGTPEESKGEKPKREKSKREKPAKDEQDTSDEPSTEGSTGTFGATTSAPTGSEAGSEAAADDPVRVPAWLTWAVVGLLGAAVGGSILVSRRRRA